MTQDEIIEMAMEAEFVLHGKPSEEESELFVCVDKDIVRFAKLVAAKEREALAQTQEPVGRFAKFTDGIWRPVTDYSAGVPLYTTPPQRTWVGLTDDERSELVTLHHGWNEYGQAIEAKLKGLNT
jgi:hypothetical protein